MNTVLSKIIDLNNSGDFYKAEIELKKIYHQNPQSFDLNKLMGMALLGQKKYNGAIKCFEKCFSKNKQDYDVVLNLSYIFTKIQFYEYSIKFSEDAIKINSSRPEAYQNLATSYFFLNNYKEAEKFTEKSIELRGGINSESFIATDDLAVLYCDILIAQEKHDEFLAFAKKILVKKYIHFIAIRLLRHDRNIIDENFISNVNQVIKISEGIDHKVDRNTNLSHANFFLAEYYADSNKALSENHYLTANKYISDMQRESLFVRQRHARNIHNFFKNFNDGPIKKAVDHNKGKGLIFVLGVPRSGTSLTESILSTADSLKAGGEKSFFSVQLHDTINSLNEIEPSKLDFDFFEDLGNRYLETIKLHKGDNNFFVDKLPENYLLYKFIMLALPSAKFIHCYRDPWDNAISLFKQNYSTNIFYASSFFGIATEFANYEFLMQQWKNMDGKSAFFDVEYEQLVKDEDSIVKALWEYCSLIGKYSPKERKKHFVYTASMQQTTKDIYTSSVEKSDFTAQKNSFLEDLEKQREYWRNKVNN